MFPRFCLLRRCAPCLLAALGLSNAAVADNTDGAADLGVDYAFMFLMIPSPDIAAANYTIENNDGSEVDIAIGRLPYHVDLLATRTRKLQLELALAYQKTEQLVRTFQTPPGEDIDATWTTYGGGLGLLYEQALTEQLHFTPNLRAGVARMTNDATYNGPLTNQIKDAFEGTRPNWSTYLSVVNLGLGLSYDGSLRDRASSLKADVCRVFVDSLGETNPAVRFAEQANMLALTANMIFPTSLAVAQKAPGSRVAAEPEQLLWREPAHPGVNNLVPGRRRQRIAVRLGERTPRARPSQRPGTVGRQHARLARHGRLQPGLAVAQKKPEPDRRRLQARENGACVVVSASSRAQDRFGSLKKSKPLSYRPRMTTALIDAIDAALAGEWHRAHNIVQQHENDPLACWIHAVLHKIEGDAGNSRYWYARTSHSYGEFADAGQELAAIRQEVERT